MGRKTGAASSADFGEAAEEAIGLPFGRLLRIGHALDERRQDAVELRRTLQIHRLRGIVRDAMITRGVSIGEESFWLNLRLFYGKVLEP